MIVAIAATVLVGRMPSPAGVLLRAIVWLVEWSLQLLIGLLILQAVLSWVYPHAPMAPALERSTQPFLGRLRRLIPRGRRRPVSDGADARSLDRPGPHRKGSAL
jgi:YggT family protein